MDTKTVKVGEVNIDPELIALRPVNLFFVSRYRQAYRAGNDLGEIIVDASTMNVVSGNHRIIALREEFGTDREVEIVLKKFKTKLKMLETFAENNISHGNALTGFSRHSIALEMLKAGGKEGSVAGMFGVSVKRIQDWCGLTVVVVGKKGKQTIEVVKDSAKHVQTMSETQYETHRKADSGMHAVEHAKQLIRWIDDGWIEDEECISTLKVLANSIYKAFPAKSEAIS